MNLYENIKFSKKEEIIDYFFQNEKYTVERILSSGQTTGFMDQIEDEWVILLEGEASIMYEDDTVVYLKRGDALFIPAHCIHRVSKTSENCIWIAIKIMR